MGNPEPPSAPVSCRFKKLSRRSPRGLPGRWSRLLPGSAGGRRPETWNGWNGGGGVRLHPRSRPVRRPSGDAGWTVDHRGAELPHHHVDRTHRVVVAGDGDVGEVGVSVGVDQADGRDAEVPCLAEGVGLAVDVDRDDRAGQLRHVADAVEVAVDLPHLAHELRFHLLRVGLDFTALDQALELDQPLETLADGPEVGEGAAEPSLRHVGELDVGAVLLDGAAGLTLGADEDDVLALRGDAGDELLGEEQTLDGLLDVDDVDAAPHAVDVRRHLGVPVAPALAEVDARFNEFLNERCHLVDPLSLRLQRHRRNTYGPPRAGRVSPRRALARCDPPTGPVCGTRRIARRRPNRSVEPGTSASSVGCRRRPGT